MPLFTINKNTLNDIEETRFKIEKDIQVLTESNLPTIFDLKFVKSEFYLNKFRIDTLAFDVTSNAFVIIEYKRDKNFSVIDQGYAYLSLMLNNKADSILEYNETNQNNLKRDDVDWSQSRILFVSQSFTTYQREAINFKDLPIELWEVKKFANETVSYNQIQTSNTTESVKTISRKDDNTKTVNKEIKVFTEDDHLLVVNDEIKELYEKFKILVINIGNIEIKPNKLYIAFIKINRNIVDFVIQKKSIKVSINLSLGELDDPKGIARDISNIGSWGNGDYEIKITSDKDLDYIVSLIKQSYDKK